MKNTNEKGTRVLYADAFSCVTAELEKALRKTAPLMREYTSYLATSNGKYIRTHALLASALGDDGTVHGNAVKFAAAIEAVHLASLVHDDVIDDADTRRGKPTLQRQYGKKKAVICGDYLFCLALSLVADIQNRETYLDFGLPNYMKRICMGEMNQLVHYKNFELTVHQYLKTISGKTAALFEASFYAGAALCTDEKKELARYRALGRYTGMIFQLMDDLLDYESDQNEVHKPVRSDFEQGVVTLPLLHALRGKAAKGKSITEGMTNEQVKTMVEASGGIAYTKAFARRYYEKSLLLLNEMALTAPKKEKLTEIVNLAFRKA